MIKVITYGTYDLLHYGHIRLLERAKALGDYLIVGITSDDYDKTRGKINNQQTRRIDGAGTLIILYATLQRFRSEYMSFVGGN